MREFNISRSTAIRDIREIEAMGVHFYYHLQNFT
ncbi:hypothetical protein [Desulfosporosinus sp. SB140]